MSTRSLDEESAEIFGKAPKPTEADIALANEVDPLAMLLARDFPAITPAEFAVRLAEYRDAAKRAEQWRATHPCCGQRPTCGVCGQAIYLD
jgi:hypothetical protein